MPAEVPGPNVYNTGVSDLTMGPGQVFQHRKFGYKGVIYGWDRSCQREPSWNVRMEVDPNQPFYSVLPDEQDCLRLFGGLRVTKYVAQVWATLLQAPTNLGHAAAFLALQGSCLEAMRSMSISDCSACRWQTPPWILHCKANQTCASSRGSQADGPDLKDHATLRHAHEDWIGSFAEAWLFEVHLPCAAIFRRTFSW